MHVCEVAALPILELGPGGAGNSKSVHVNILGTGVPGESLQRQTPADYGRGHCVVSNMIRTLGSAKGNNIGLGLSHSKSKRKVKKESSGIYLSAGSR